MKLKLFILLYGLLFSLNIKAQPIPQLIKDISPGPGTSAPWRFIQMNEILYFVANDGVNGSELWRTDATEAGTYMVKNIGSGDFDLCESTNGCREESIVMNNILYFKASDPVHGAELWRSDGTEAGTYLLKDINPGIGDCTNYYMSGQYFAVLNDILYFAADDGNNVELWRSDGTEAGTYLVKDFAAGISSFPQYITAIENYIYFRCINALGNAELWKSDGTDAGSVLLKQLWIYSPEYKNMFIEYDEYIYFAGGDDPDNIYNFELWRTDGTPAGTALFMDINEVEEVGSTPHQFHILNDKLLFSADNSHNIYISDGTVAGTAKLSDHNGNEFDATYEAYLLAESKFYFQATNDEDELGLWVTDGTNAGTKFLSAIESGVFSEYANFNDYYATAVNGNNIIYRGYDDENGCAAIFQSDGTAPGTFQTLECDILSSVSSIITYNGKVILSGVADTYGGELWMFEPEFNTGLHNFSESDRITIYPNPASEYLQFSNIGQEISNDEIEIHNIEGKIMKSYPFSDRVSISDLIPGIYFITINNTVSKFIKE